MARAMRYQPTLLVFALIAGCATAPHVPGTVHLGMSRTELLASCGQPYQKSAKDGSETLKYCERIYDTPIGNWWMTRPVKACTNVHLKEGSVIAYESAAEKD